MGWHCLKKWELFSYFIFVIACSISDMKKCIKLVLFTFFRKPKRITGFALKQLEKNFPKGTKHLKDFYNWSKDRDSEFNLLQKISKSL